MPRHGISHPDLSLWTHQAGPVSSLDAMPSQTFAHTAVTAASIEQAWGALQQPETWEAIGGIERVSDPRRAPDGRLMGFEFAFNAGGRYYAGRATTVRSERPERMTVEIDTSEMAGTMDVALAADGASKVSVAVTLSIRSKGLLSGLFFPLIAESIGAGLPANVDRFAAALAADAP